MPKNIQYKNQCFFTEVPSASAFDSNGLLDDEPIQTSVFRQEREEPEKIKAWREEQKQRLEEKGKQNRK